MTPFKRNKKFSLQLHIVSLFTILIIISGASLGWYSYNQLSKNMILSGKTLLNNSSAQLVEKISIEKDHIHTMLKILSASNLSKATSKKQKISSLPVLSEMLKASSALSALFIAYPNNDFFLYKILQSQSVLEKYKAPKASYFMMTLRQSENTVHHFYDISGELLKVVEDPNYNMQIKQRPWYKLAKNSDTFALTEAYLFYASQEFGVTMAVHDKIHGTVMGADYILGTLSKMLEEFRDYPSSQRIVVNQHGIVIAYQDTDKLLSEDGKFDRFKSIESINQPVLAHLFNNYKGQFKSVQFSFNGEDWLGTVSELSDKNHLRLLQLVKEKELLSEAYILRHKSVLITLLIILTTLPIAWYFARLLTAPIGGLTKELQQIKNFDFSQKIHSTTLIKEISDLIAATNNMKETISHFLDLSASLVSKQSHQQLLSKISEECNNIPNCQGTLIILNDQQQCQIKHCNIPSLTHAQNTTLEKQLATITLSCEQLLDNEQQHIIPAQIKQIISTQLSANKSLNWQLVPMKNKSGKNLGLIAILESQQALFTDGKLQYAQAIASFSALSIQSQQLLAEQKQLLESFILLIAGAIDSKSHYTGGHCARVPELTKMLSRAACNDTEGDYKSFNLSSEQWEELHIAAWLHDCGKIVTPEYVVDKATKLETIYDRLNEVRMRFELLISDVN